ncbi:hypothetical protein VT84_31295 [Gemmata sp. SH-PL17]|uniref:hypothetical protein n=1 Tax=Gemmata sp. SH-PL17 TaxID=1630693 RepID=UPI00078E4E90|nr:hypothetical protein [Gemmata sp. SH-PL17]AMV28921.1 hypothetical protein VT84_31295 [Gemmata sp. SH-PL17]
MRKLLPLAAVLIALTSTRADEKISAPVPKTPPPPSIEGKYTLVATYNGAVAVREKGGFGGGPGGGVGAEVGGFAPSRTTIVRGETVISRTEIVIESRTVTGIPTTMEYTLDPTKSPITIDVEIVPVRGKKTRGLGVVEITNNRVVIALAKEGADRPKSVEEAEGVTVYYFQKAPPAPRTEFRIVALTVGKEEEAEKELNRLAKEGYELVSTTNPTAPDAKASVTTVHFILKRIVK